MSSESREHKRIKDLVHVQLRKWTGATLEEYPSSGHELDNFAVTKDGTSVYVEVIWSESAQNFYRDLSMIQTANANIKIIVASPKIIENEKYNRAFQKVVISQRRIGIAMHGELINGEKVIKEPAYLDGEFKTLFFDLLETIEKQGKAIGSAADLIPPQPKSPDRREEKLFSNLFPVVEYPSAVFSGKTSFRRDADIFRTLGSAVEGHPFLLKNRRIYVFDNLKKPSSLFSKWVDRDDIITEDSNIWLQDVHRKNQLMRMLNIAKRTYFEKTRGLFFDKEHGRFICLLKDGKDNYFTWRSVYKYSERAVAKRIYGEGRERLFCTHYAASLGFVSVDERVFLKIEPTMVFTYDGYEPIKSTKLSKLITRYLSKQYNYAYLSLVRFWAKYLSRLDLFITIPTGDEVTKVSVYPAGTCTEIGIADEEKIRMRRQKGKTRK